MTDDSRQSSKNAWPKVPIGELLTRVSRAVDVDETETYRQIGIRSHCKGIFHKPPVTGKALGNKRVFWVEPGCLIFNIIFAWEQAVAVTTSAEQGMIASHRFPMYVGNGKLLPEYAHLYFSSPRGKYDLSIASPGGAGRNKTLGQEEFKRLRIPVPPIGHQQLTIDVVATWDRAIKGVQKLIRAKHRLKQGLAQQLLTGDRRLPGFKQPWQGWRLCEVASLIFSNVDKKSHSDETPVRLCNYTDVYYHDEITPGMPLMEATAKESEIKKFGLEKWDVIITKDSETPDDIAKPAVVTSDLPGVVCGYHLAIVRCNEHAHGPFLAQLFRSTRVRHEFMKIANGATRYGLVQSSLSKLPLKLPDTDEQRAISNVLGAIDRETRLLQRKRKLLVEQRNGLMQNLISDNAAIESKG